MDKSSLERLIQKFTFSYNFILSRLFPVKHSMPFFTKGGNEEADKVVSPSSHQDIGLDISFSYECVLEMWTFEPIATLLWISLIFSFGSLHTLHPLPKVKSSAHLELLSRKAPSLFHLSWLFTWEHKKVTHLGNWVSRLCSQGNRWPLLHHGTCSWPSKFLSWNWQTSSSALTFSMLPGGPLMEWDYCSYCVYQPVPSHSTGNRGWSGAEDASLVWLLFQMSCCNSWGCS